MCSRSRRARVAAVLVWFGPIAAALDLAQDVALALVLAGRHTQPWPSISAYTAIFTRSMAEGAFLFAVLATALTVLCFGDWEP